MVTKNFFFSNNLIEISKKAAILEKDEEFYLINDWRDNKTPKSLQKILNSYLRLAVSYARKYSSYGLPIDDDAEYIAKLDACDAKSLMQFVAEYINLKNRVQLIIGPNPLK